MFRCRIERHDSTSQLLILQDRPLLHGICSSDPKQKLWRESRGRKYSKCMKTWSLTSTSSYCLWSLGHNDEPHRSLAVLAQSRDWPKQLKGRGVWKLAGPVILLSVKAALTPFYDDRFYKNVTLKNAQNLRTCWEEAEEYFEYTHFFIRTRLKFGQKLRTT